MDILMFLLMWLGGFLTLLIGDFLWLGKVMRKTIMEEFKPYIEIKDGQTQMRLGIGILAWIIISLGCVYFVSLQVESVIQAIGIGAFFGFILYACYDLTNYTFFMKYSKRFVIIDILWGTFICSMVSLTGFLIKSSIELRGGLF
ncbi:MAG: DUF2177 family protein [Nanoarchaeota archaeon]|nr:DUF2177 family protein [Nanoarchaeota archaeon]